VIGVILMVAITVILAAVIGTFVIGLGDDIGSTTPSASIQANQVSDSVTEEETILTFTHQSGDRIDGENLRLSYAISEAVEGDENAEFGETIPSTFRSGDEVSLNLSNAGDIDNGDAILEEQTVRLVFEDGDQSATLRTLDIDEVTYNAG